MDIGIETKKLRILLVEDNAGDANLVRENLLQDDSNQFELETVELLSRALESLSERHWDAILLDLSLPDSKGLETFLKIHACVPEVPIVVLTGLNDETTATLAVESGAQDYMIKGETDYDSLHRTLRFSIERKEMQEQLHKLYLHSHKKLDRIEELLMIDELTQLFNRRFLDQELNNEIERAIRYNDSFSVMMLDLDNFKEINDRFGHQTGDQMLKKFASLIRSNFRKTDLLCRFGGDEFVIILPKADAQTAVTLAKKLRRKLNAHPTDMKSLPKVSITASIGISEYKKGDDSAALLKRVDSALYAAKKRGRKGYIYCAA